MLEIKVENLEMVKEKLATVDAKTLIKPYLKGELLSSSMLPKKMVEGNSHCFDRVQ